MEDKNKKDDEISKLKVRIRTLESKKEIEQEKGIVRLRDYSFIRLKETDFEDDEFRIDFGELNFVNGKIDVHTAIASKSKLRDLAKRIDELIRNL